MFDLQSRAPLNIVLRTHDMQQIRFNLSKCVLCFVYSQFVQYYTHPSFNGLHYYE